MIINKVQRTEGNQKFIDISYIKRDGQVHTAAIRVGDADMFEWVYATSPKNAEPGYKSFDNKLVCKRFYTKYDEDHKLVINPEAKLSDYRVNEILASFGDKLDCVYAANTPETWYCDIETDVDDSGFPDPDSTPTPVNTIAITHFPTTILFARKQLTADEQKSIQNKLNNYANGQTAGYQFVFKGYNSEADMLDAFFKFIENKAHITGWNFLGYDWLYLINRAKKINLKTSYLSKETRNFKVQRRITVNVKVPVHQIISDYMLIYKQWDRSISPKENDTLDWVADKVLNYKKVQHPWGFAEFYKDHYEEYCFYNLVDTILVEKIDAKLKTAQIWYMLASILKIELNSAFSTITPLESVMTYFLYPEKRVLLKKDYNKKLEDTPDESYEGAYVWPTRAGIFRYVAGLDYASLYPTIIRQFGISPEMFIGKYDDAYKPKKDEIKLKTGAVFKKNPDALLPAITTKYFALRKEAKNDRLICDTDAEKLIAEYERITGKKFEEEE